MFMTAPDKRIGNKFYLLRSKDGRDRIYQTADDLWEKCCEYFQYVEENPLKEERAFSTKFGIEIIELSKRRAMTLAGLYIWLGISEGTFLNYRKIPEFKWVVETVDNTMYAQKFEGAAAGLLNPNIIARDLGLVDKRKVDTDVSITKKNFNDFYDDDDEKE